MQGNSNFFAVIFLSTLQPLDILKYFVVKRISYNKLEFKHKLTEIYQNKNKVCYILNNIITIRKLKLSKFMKKHSFGHN